MYHLVHIFVTSILKALFLSKWFCCWSWCFCCSWSPSLFLRNIVVVFCFPTHLGFFVFNCFVIDGFSSSFNRISPLFNSLSVYESKLNVFRVLTAQLLLGQDCLARHFFCGSNTCFVSLHPRKHSLASNADDVSWWEWSLKLCILIFIDMNSWAHLDIK